MARELKIVWIEGNEVHSARGRVLGEESPQFVKIQLFNGTILSIARQCILKIEEVPYC